MLEMTWPYGTKRKAKVLEARTAKMRGAPISVIVCEDENGEGHILAGTDSEECKAGDYGFVVFTNGGPKGGYWRFTHGEVVAAR